jgi:hypothetical protein
MASFFATPKQIELMDTICSGDYLYIAMGGGIRGTKTFGTISAIIALCKIFPRSRWAIVRKDLPTIRRNTIPSFNKLRDMADGFVGPIHQQTWTAKCANGSEIIFFPEGILGDPELERWKGLEVNGFLLEEATELAEKTANKAIERAGSWIIPPAPGDPTPEQPPPLVLFTFNPGRNFVYEWFYLPYSTGTLKAPYKFIPATAADNPFIPDAVRKAWLNLPEIEYRRFVKGEWDALDDPDQLIKFEWITAARNREPTPGPRKGGADVARFGDDNSAIAIIEDHALRFLETHSGLKTTAVGREIVRVGLEWQMDADAWQVDSVGLGGGAVDTCHDLGYPVREFIAGGRTVWRGEDSFFKFANRRSQAWWEFRESLREGPFSLPQEMSETLVADLTSVKYEISGDKVISVWPKERLKKILGRSPDEGDAVVMAAFDAEVEEPILAGTTSFRSY